MHETMRLLPLVLDAWVGLITRVCATTVNGHKQRNNLS